MLPAKTWLAITGVNGLLFASVRRRVSKGRLKALAFAADAIKNGLFMFVVPDINSIRPELNLSAKQKCTNDPQLRALYGRYPAQAPFSRAERSRSHDRLKRHRREHGSANAGIDIPKRFLRRRTSVAAVTVEPVACVVLAVRLRSPLSR